MPVNQATLHTKKLERLITELIARVAKLEQDAATKK